LREQKLLQKTQLHFVESVPGEQTAQGFVSSHRETKATAPVLDSTRDYAHRARGADAGVELRIRRALAETENRAVQRSSSAQHEISLRR